MNSFLLALALSLSATQSHGNKTPTKTTYCYLICWGGNMLTDRVQKVLEKHDIHPLIGESAMFSVSTIGTKADALKAVRVLRAAHIKGVHIYDPPQLQGKWGTQH